MRSPAALGLALLALAVACGESDDRPDLAAPPPQTTETLATVPTTSDAGTATQSVTAVRTSTRLRPGERRRIAEQASAAEAAVEQWNSALDSCLGPSGTAHDPGGTCMRAAWEQLFDQIYAVQYELLALGDVRAGACHRRLAAAVDAAHGFLSGATPLSVVWLDDQQRPPSVYDLEAIVDVARPLPARLHEVEATCGG
jgi:hypothetical protein